MSNGKSQTTAYRDDVKCRLLLACSEALRCLHFDGTVADDIILRLSGAEAELRMMLESKSP